MEQLKHMLDGVSLAAVLSSVFNALPAVLTVISTSLAIVWYCIRIGEYLKNKKVSDGH